MKVNSNKSDLCSGTPIKKTEMTIKTPQLIPGRQTARKYRIFWYRPNSPNRIRISSKFIAAPWWHFLTPPMPDCRGQGGQRTLDYLINQCLSMILNPPFEETVYLEIFKMSRKVLHGGVGECWIEVFVWCEHSLW